METIGVDEIRKCYDKFVNYSIRFQMQDALEKDEMLGEKHAARWIYHCFEIKPDKEQLYRIRNDINHGNIRENSGRDYERVYLRVTCPRLLYQS
jgi:helix-turn-helix protein